MPRPTLPSLRYHRPPADRRASMPWGVRVGVRALCASLSLLVIVASGIAWATFQDFTEKIPHGAPVPGAAKDPDGGAQNILLLGNDTRAGASPAELRALESGFDRTTVNADTMMLLHVPAGGGRPTLVSFPRDLWVTVPGSGKGKMNSAYPDAYNTARQQHRSELASESAGIMATIRTVQALTGLRVDHYVQVSLIGFYRISNAIGGVPVCLKNAQNRDTETDGTRKGFSGIDLPKGRSLIKGTQALAFVRQRHGLPHGDLDRVRRQQYFLSSAFHKITSAGTVLNPFKMHDLLDAIGSSLLTDPALDPIALARQFQSLTGGGIDFATIPNNGPKLIYPDGVETAIVELNSAALPAFVAQLEGKRDDALHDAKAAAPSTVTIDVLNGTDVPRLGARNAAVLQQRGFRVNTVDSSDTTPARTTVLYPAGKEAQAKALLAAVPRAVATVTPDVSRVTLVIGANQVMATGVRSATPKPTTAAPSSKGAAKPAAGDGLGCID